METSVGYSSKDTLAKQTWKEAGDFYFSFLQTELPYAPLPSRKKKKKKIPKALKSPMFAWVKRWGKMGKLTQIKYEVTYLLSVLQLTRKPSQIHELIAQVRSCCPHSREWRKRLMDNSRTYTLKILSQIIHDILKQGTNQLGEDPSIRLTAAFYRKLDLCFQPSPHNSSGPSSLNPSGPSSLNLPTNRYLTALKSEIWDDHSDHSNKITIL